MDHLLCNEACVTLWPTEASVVCRPFTDDETRCHIHCNGSRQSYEGLLAKVVEVCLENDCSTIHIRQENWED